MSEQHPDDATAPNPDSVEARLTRAEQTINLLLRMIHAHGEMHLEKLHDSFDVDELSREWDAATTERFGHLPDFRPLGDYS